MHEMGQPVVEGDWYVYRLDCSYTDFLSLRSPPLCSAKPHRDWPAGHTVRLVCFLHVRHDAQVIRRLSAAHLEAHDVERVGREDAIDAHEGATGRVGVAEASTGAHEAVFEASEVRGERR